MKKLNIREAKITKEMYNEAKKIENLWKKTKKMDCRTEEFKKLNNKVIKMSDKFEEEVCDDFDTLEIVNEYERRMRKEKEENKQSEDKNMYNSKKVTREATHRIAWLMSLASLPVAIISVCKGATPLQITGWLVVVIAVQLSHLLPEALKEKEVYNDDIK